MLSVILSSFLGKGKGSRFRLWWPHIRETLLQCWDSRPHVANRSKCIAGRDEEDADKLTSLGRQFRRMQHYLPDPTREVTNNLAHYDLNRQDSRHFRCSRVPGDLVSRSLGLLKGSNKQPKNSNSQVEAPQVRAITP